MPRAFVKQPNGKLAYWSTIVDNFLVVDCTADEAIIEALEREDGPNGERGYPGNIREDLCRELENIAKTGRAWKWAPTWEEAVALIREVHGEEELAKVLALIAEPAQS